MPTPCPLPPGGGGEEDFAFEFDAKRFRVTPEQMLRAIRARGEHHGGPFTIKQFDAWAERPCCADCIRERFGSWRRALMAAGIEGAKGFNYSPQELIENLEMVWRKLGRRPGAQALADNGTIGMGAYNRVWGSVRRACLLFSRYKRGEITREELLTPLQEGKTRKKISPSLRWRILERGGHRCAGCGRGSAEVMLEVDHIVPVCRGGKDEEGNLRVLCRDCNRGKGGGGGQAAMGSRQSGMGGWKGAVGRREGMEEG